MTSKLSLYNNTLIRLDARKLSSLTENRKSRRVLDAIWDNNFVRRILENGQFNTAIRSFQSTYDVDVSPQFGYQYAHEKPSDWVRTVGLSASEYISPPILEYTDEGGYWYCNHDTLYASIISDGASYGGDLSLWPESVAEYAEIELAARACKAITGSDEMTARLNREAETARKKAKSIDQMNQAPKFAPLGSWVGSRLGMNGRRKFSVADTSG